MDTQTLLKQISQKLESNSHELFQIKTVIAFSFVSTRAPPPPPLPGPPLHLLTAPCV